VKHSIALIERPADEPISLAEAKAHLRLEADETEEDALIGGLIAAAREHVEGQTGRALVAQTFKLRLPHFPLGDVIRLPRGPVVEVLEVAYRDTAGTARTFADWGGDLGLQPAEIWPHVAPVGQGAWPSGGYAVEITFRAGYGGPADVPASIKQAMLLLVGHWWANRESVLVGAAAGVLPMGVEALLSQHRIVWF